ncbi:MAG: hypothetical protein CMP14_11415 [Rickettsiales bacterium]|mgnify:CR=1 FL=1|nr:hypothetical protein [Rickettsiales bacterium]
MSAENIAAAGAANLPITVIRQPHPFYEGEFLDTVRTASNAPIVSTTVPTITAPIVLNEWVDDAEPEVAKFSGGKPNKSAQIPHPFYEGEFLDPEERKKLFADGTPGLADLIDVINPLQHIPVISSIYRAITGDEISPAARLTGGALFGGPVGLAGAYISGVVEDVTDTSIGEIIVTAFTGGGDTDIKKQSPITTASGAQTVLEKKPAPPERSPQTQPVATFPIKAALQDKNPSPLSLARTLLESPTSAYATPSVASTKAIVSADEELRQNQHLPDPASAVLAARSQVPRGGNIQALGVSRMSPSNFEAVTSALQPDMPNTAAETRGTDGSRFALSRNSGNGPFVPGKRGAPPLRNNSDISTSPRRSAAAVTNVPNSKVPTAMISALNKYEKMLQQRHNVADDLAM